MKVIVCCAGEAERRRLCTLLMREGLRKNLSVEIARCIPRLLEGCLEKTQCDICFLDLSVGGFEVARRVAKSNRPVRMVFLSEDPEDILRVLPLQPLWFIDKARLALGLRVTFALLEQSDRCRTMYEFGHGTAENRRIVRLANVMFVSSDDHQLTVQMTDGRFRQYTSLSSLERELSEIGFLRIHKSFLINRRHIKEIRGDELILTDGIRLPIAKNRRKYVREELLNGF